MSLWTPSGEHPVGDDRPTQRAGGTAGDAPTAATTRAPGGPVGGQPDGGQPDGGQPDGGQPDGGHHDEGDASAELDALRRQLAEAPADVVVANHCYGLFELAAVYLSDSPPHLESARLAIDALGVLVDGLGERLGEGYPSLRDSLAHIRLGFVQIAAAQEHAPENEAGPPAAP